MADDDTLQPDDELEQDEPLEIVDPAEDEAPPDDADLAADDAHPDDDQQRDDQEPAARRRGPDASQRDRRRAREDDFERAVERAVERRLGRQNPAPQVDWAAQQRELQARRQRELEDARLQGPEAYADAQNRHLREDSDARERARDMRYADDRQADRWDRLCERSAVYDNLRDDVEREVQRLKSNGIYAPDRQLIANALFGQRQIERLGRVKGQQQRRADETTRSRTVNAPANRSSQITQSRRRGARNFADMSVSDMEAALGSIPVRGNSTT